MRAACASEPTASTILPMCALDSISACASAGPRQRKDRMHHRPDAARLDQRPDDAAQARCDRRLELDRSRTQGRTRYRQATSQHGRKIDLRLRAAEQRDDRQPAVIGEAG